jgi:hypothetical protein
LLLVAAAVVKVITVAAAVLVVCLRHQLLYLQERLTQSQLVLVALVAFHKQQLELMALIHQPLRYRRLVVAVVEVETTL